MENSIYLILNNLLLINKENDQKISQLLENYIKLNSNEEYSLLYKNISGYLAHADVEKYVYDGLSKILDILEDKYI